MTDKLSAAEVLERIKQVLQQHPNGAAIEDIEAQSDLNMPRRTLQRRLLKLQQTGDVRIEGKTRATKYMLLAEKNLLRASVQTFAQSVIPLSKAARSIRQHVSGQIQQRSPVGYNRKFLDNYQPNISTYLTSVEMAKLAKLGNTGIPKQPAGTYAKEILSRLLIDLSWNSSRLEGNTYSLLDTQRLIAFGEIADGKSAAEAQMILNHKDAIEFLTQAAEDIRFNRYTILNLHALLANNLLPDPAASGRLRSFAVGVHQSVYIPLAAPQLISELFDLFLKKAEQIHNPFEQALFMMVQLPYLQPFDDVNKRVSRLAANIPFLQHNLAPLSFIDVPEDLYISGMLGVYEQNRVELLKEVFIWAYERSAVRYSAIRQSLGEPDPFRLKYREQIRAMIHQIVAHNMKPKAASEKIKSTATQLPQIDQEKFIQVVETELISLHAGNFARYGIRPAQFNTWQALWLAD